MRVLSGLGRGNQADTPAAFRLEMALFQKDGQLCRFFQDLLGLSRRNSTVQEGFSPLLNEHPPPPVPVLYPAVLYQVSNKDTHHHDHELGQPLALDVQEEFRPTVVDRLVLNVVNRGMLTAADFEPGTKGGVRLKRKALRTFFRQYSARLNTQVLHPGVGRKLTYQQWFEVQARTLRETIEGTRPTYRPVVVR